MVELEMGKLLYNQTNLNLLKSLPPLNLFFNFLSYMLTKKNYRLKK